MSVIATLLLAAAPAAVPAATDAGNEIVVIGRKRLQRREIGVAPFLVAPGGKGDRVHAATAS